MNKIEVKRTRPVSMPPIIDAQFTCAQTESDHLILSPRHGRQGDVWITARQGEASAAVLIHKESIPEVIAILQELHAQSVHED